MTELCGDADTVDEWCCCVCNLCEGCPSGLMTDESEDDD